MTKEELIEKIENIRLDSSKYDWVGVVIGEQDDSSYTGYVIGYDYNKTDERGPEDETILYETKSGSFEEINKNNDWGVQGKQLTQSDFE